MAQEKIGFEQFLEVVEAKYQDFIQDMHNYLLDNGCKEKIEEKKSGFLASYKHTKLKKSIANLLFRKKGMIVRIYGENANKYLDFLNTLPEGMLEAIDSASVCKRLVYNTCSPKCSGYDFIIGNEHFQKCKYNCFEFLVTEENNPYIKSFVEHELRERTAQR